MRSPDYVRRLLAAELKRKGPARAATKAKSGDRRSAYAVRLSLTVPERRAIQERARKEERSVSNYATMAVLGALERR